MQISEHIYEDFISGRIESFYASAYAPLIMYATRALGSEYAFLAEDCVQDAVFEAYQHRYDFESNAKLKSFLYRCVHNKAITFLRKSNSQSNYLIRNTEDQHCFNNSIIEQETLDLLYDAIERLPDDMKKVFEMSFEQGMRNQEIADALGLSVAAVKKRKAKMINLLRSQMAMEELMMMLSLVMLSGRG